MRSIQITRNGEPVIISFKSLKNGLEIAKLLQQENIESDAEHADQIRYIRCLSAFALQQPNFVDIYSNQLDHRVSIPGQAMSRTLTAGTDHEAVQNLFSLNKMKYQQPQQPQQQKFQQPPIQQPVQPVQANIPAASSSNQDQIYRLIYQILIQVFSREPNLLMQASVQTGIRLDKGDPQQLSTLVKAMTQRLMRYPTHEMLQRLQEFQNISPDMKEKIVELLGKQEPPKINLPNLPIPAQIPASIPRMSMEPAQRPQPMQQQPQMQQHQQQQQNFGQMQQQIQQPQQMQQQQPQQQQQQQQQQGAKTDPSSKINQAILVMSQLEPQKISQLIHSQIPVFGKQYNYHIDKVNQMKLSSEGRVNLPMQNIIRSVSLTWFSQIGKTKTPLQGETDLSQKIVKLYERQSETHQRIVNNNELSAYHKTFNNDENMAIALLVHAQTMKQRNDDSFQWTQLTDEVTKNIQLNVFDALQRLVEKHKTTSQPQQPSQPVLQAPPPPPPQPTMQQPLFMQQIPNKYLNQDLHMSPQFQLPQPPKAPMQPQMPQQLQLPPQQMQQPQQQQPQQPQQQQLQLPQQIQPPPQPQQPQQPVPQQQIQQPAQPVPQQQAVNPIQMPIQFSTQLAQNPVYQAPPPSAAAPPPPPPAPAAAPRAKTTQMSPEFQQQIKEIYLKLINSVDSVVITKSLLLILGLGMHTQLNKLSTHAFFESSLMLITRQGTFDTSQEKLFIIVTGLIPQVLQFLQTKDGSGKTLLYKINNENLPSFDQFFEEYQKTVQKVNQMTDKSNIGKLPVFLLTDIEIRSILQQSNEKTIQQVIDAIGITTVIKKEEPEIKQKVGQQIRSAFGVERSETDSDDM
ncbi:Conserved_hypothetical protein [Hexamita inflata]|uniref:Uncharacterized protein n=1 Tax=Hexamita inflata TaxID=28002 RepID=A0AA86QK94_9EUKA|nr:Conserved hypothetical protein [Hexamita inflata]